MEVTHFTDYNTHAVLGGGEAEAFGIENNAQFVTMLSSTLYSNAFLAVAREVICNAWDAHKDADIRDIPIDITLDEDELIIRDYGKGIPHKTMLRIYCTYGGSTKQDDANQTGGFGLGTKSPFAYTDYYTVDNRNGGMRRTFAISRGNAETKGMPDARPIVEVPTDETGLSVRIPIKDAQDVREFKKHIESVVYFGEMNVNLNGEKLETINLSTSEENLILTRRSPPSMNGRIYVRYGNVVYPVETSREYSNLYSAVDTLIEEANNKANTYGGWDRSNSPFYLIFDAPANSVSVTPSRESLHMSQRTIDTVQALLGEFIDRTRMIDIGTMVEDQQEVIFNYFRKMDQKNIRSLMYDDNIIRKYLMEANGWSKLAQSIAFTRIYDFIMFKVAHGHYKEQSVTNRDQRLKIVDFILSTKPYDADLLVKLRKIIASENWTRSAQGWRAFKHYTGLVRRMTAAGLDPKRLWWWKPHAYAGRKQFAGDLFIDSSMTLDDLIALSNRVIYYTNTKQSMSDHYAQEKVPGFRDYQDNYGLLLYIDIRKNAPHEKNIEFFKQQGFLVVDVYTPNKPEEVFFEVTEKVKVAPEPKKKKPKGWPALNSLVHFTGEVDVHRVRRSSQLVLNAMHWLSKPEFYLKPYKNKGEQNILFPWGKYDEHVFLKHFGDKGVISISETQNRAIAKTGAIDGIEYIVNAVCDYMANNMIFRDHNVFDHLIGNLPVDVEALMEVKKHVIDLQDMPLELPPLTEEQENYQEMFRSLVRMSHRLPRHLRDKVNDLMPVIYGKVTSETPNPYYAFLPADLRKRMKAVDIDSLLDVLDDPNVPMERQVWAKTTLTLLFMK